MSEFNTWIAAIDANNFDAWTREMLIKEAQKTGFVNPLPSGFEFLSDRFVYLGFDHLDLPQDEFWKLLLAFVGAGVAVPGSPYRLRNIRPFRSVVEPTTGDEQATLPAHWKEVVLVFGHQERFTWIGRRVHQDRHGGSDLNDYQDADGGWVLKRGRLHRPRPANAATPSRQNA